MSPYTLGVAYAILTGACWAVLAIALKYALHFSSTGTIIWARMVVAFGITFVVYFVRHRHVLKKVFWPPPRNVVLAGLLLAFNYYGYMKGLELTGASNAQIMIQVGPLTLLFLGVFYFKERIQPSQWLGIALAFVGFVLFYWDQWLVSAEHQDTYLAGNIWIFTAALTWAAFGALQKNQFRHGWTPQMINLLIYGVCCVALFPLAKLEEFKPLTSWQWFVMLSLGLNTLIAYGALGEAMHKIPASIVSLIISINPLLTILLVGLIAELGLTFISPEPILWRGYLGAMLVVVGVGIAVSFKRRKNKTH